MYILGISGGIKIGNQDGSAAILRDGKLIAVAEEERFIRDKHAPGRLPRRAIGFCLRKAGISICDVDVVAFPGQTYKNMKTILANYFNFHFGYNPEIRLIDHHKAHVASTYYPSGFNEAMILTADYSGDRISTLLAYGNDREIHALRRFKKPNSLGIFYSLMTQYLGFEKDNDEYKVMGLSSYGEANHNLSWLLRKTERGYKLNEEYLQEGHLKPDQPAPSKQEPIFNSELIKKMGKPRLPDEKITQYYMDVAASVQRKLEEVVLHLVRRLSERTGSRNLCLAGGVALNCVMNQKLLESGYIDNIFVQPASSDAGISLGSAIEIAVENGFEIEEMKHAYWGPEYSDDEIRGYLEGCSLDYENHNDVEEFVARELADGKIVGWFQGRMEYGPRALGNRSILADPRDPEMKDKLNRTVKFREYFRPFAPSVLLEYVDEYFVNGRSSPFMTINFDVREAKRKEIPAVTHVDGTSRIQTVDKETNPRYHKLIEEFSHITGVPVVLNTSFNIMAQPIICTPREAISTFYGTGMDILVMGNYLLQK